MTGIVGMRAAVQHTYIEWNMVWVEVRTRLVGFGTFVFLAVVGGALGAIGRVACQSRTPSMLAGIFQGYHKQSLVFFQARSDIFHGSRKEDCILKPIKIGYLVLRMEKGLTLAER